MTLRLERILGVQEGFHMVNMVENEECCHIISEDVKNAVILTPHADMVDKIGILHGCSLR